MRTVSDTLSPLAAEELLADGEAQHLAAETEHRGLKAQARAGRGLKEERCQDFAVALVCVGLGVVDDVIGRGRPVSSISSGC